MTFVNFISGKIKNADRRAGSRVCLCIPSKNASMSELSVCAVCVPQNSKQNKMPMSSSVIPEEDAVFQTKYLHYVCKVIAGVSASIIP
jgi:hypothetical protein